jgi:hypothetical protein
MKKTLFIVTLSILGFLLVLGGVYAQTNNQGDNLPPQAGRYGPYQGYGYGMGPGMMGGQGYGYGMGPGMIGPGYGYGPNQQYPYAQQQPQKPIDKDQAKSMVENYLSSTGNPNLKLGAVKDEGQNFEADVVTKDNSLADKILIDKNTGWMRPAY